MYRELIGLANGPQRLRRMRFLPEHAFPTRKRPRPRAELQRRTARAKTSGPLPDVCWFSACRDPELAADGEFYDRANGAMSYYTLVARTDLIRAAAGRGYTYGHLANALRDLLPNDEYTQHPIVTAPAKMLAMRVPF